MPHAIASDGARIHYTLTGDSGPWVVLLQGLGLSGRFWFQVPQRLLADPTRPRRVVVIDNRGTGHSDAPKRPWGMGRMADDAVNVLDHLGASRAVFAGTSMGGMICQHIGLRHPYRVSGLVLMATGPGLPFGKLPAWSSITQLVSLRFVEEEEAGRRLANLLVPRSRRDEAEALLAGWPEALREEAADKRSFLYHLGAVTGHNTFFKLGRIACPTAVVTGEEDILMPPANSRILADRIPNARYVELPGVAHDINCVDPDAVGRCVTDLVG